MHGTLEKIPLPVGQSFRLLRWNNSPREAECLVGPNKFAPVSGEGENWHYHWEMELTLFTNGDGTRFVGDHIGQFGSGDLVLLGEKLPHYWHSRAKSAGISVQWHFPQSHALWAFPEMLPLAELFRKASRGLHITGQTAAAVTRDLIALPKMSAPTRLAHFLQILVRLASAAESDRKVLSRQAFDLSPASRYQQAMAAAVRYLIAHYRDEIRLEDLLEVTQLSRPTFARQFKQHAGRTFSEFINRLRLNAACRELQENDHSILDIAIRSGFTQLSFFNRLFRRLLKCTPTDYRRKAKSRVSRPA
jgi:AraC-like DNA-binding protein